MSSDIQLTESEMVEEVEAILRTEQTGIGWMYRALKEGVPREKIMEEFQAQTSGFIYSYQKHISVLLFGTFPQAPSTSRQCAGVIRGFLRRNSGQLSGQTVEALTKFGEKIGVAFQVADDLLDVTSDETASGKTPGTDLKEGVPTLVTLYVIAANNPDDKDLSPS